MWLQGSRVCAFMRPPRLRTCLTCFGVGSARCQVNPLEPEMRSIAGSPERMKRVLEGRDPNNDMSEVRGCMYEMGCDSCEVRRSWEGVPLWRGIIVVAWRLHFPGRLEQCVLVACAGAFTRKWSWCVRACTACWPVGRCGVLVRRSTRAPKAVGQGRCTLLSPSLQTRSTRCAWRHRYFVVGAGSGVC